MGDIRRLTAAVRDASLTPSPFHSLTDLPISTVWHRVAQMQRPIEQTPFPRVAGARVCG